MGRKHLHVYFNSKTLSGWASAAILDVCRPGALLSPMNNNKAFPFDTLDPQCVTYLIGYCPEYFDTMEYIFEQSNLIWIIGNDVKIERIAEEHQIKERALSPSDVFIDYNKGLCEIVYKWQYEVDYEKVPYYLKLLGQYEIGNYSDPNTVPFQYGARAWLDDPKKAIAPWKKLIYMMKATDKKFLDGIIEDGKAIIRYIEKKNSNSEYSKVF